MFVDETYVKLLVKPKELRNKTDEKNKMKNNFQYLSKLLLQSIYSKTLRIMNGTKNSTVKFLNFRMPENFAVIYPKFTQKAQTLGYLVKKMPME